MPSMRLLLTPMRTAQQGVHVNVGKDGDQYKTIVTTLSLHSKDMESLGVSDGDAVQIRSEFGGGGIYLPARQGACRNGVCSVRSTDV